MVSPFPRTGVNEANDAFVARRYARTLAHGTAREPRDRASQRANSGTFAIRSHRDTLCPHTTPHHTPRVHRESCKQEIRGVRTPSGFHCSLKDGCTVELPTYEIISRLRRVRRTTSVHSRRNFSRFYASWSRSFLVGLTSHRTDHGFSTRREKPLLRTGNRDAVDSPLSGARRAGFLLSRTIFQPLRLEGNRDQTRRDETRITGADVLHTRELTRVHRSSRYRGVGFSLIPETATRGLFRVLGTVPRDETWKIVSYELHHRVELLLKFILNVVWEPRFLLVYLRLERIK